MAIALAEKGHNLPYSFNRKEAKDHGEGGIIVGAPLTGRVLIVDDVITDGDVGARIGRADPRRTAPTPAGVLIAFDRMERGQGERSAVQEVRDAFGIPVIAIATLDDLHGVSSPARPALAAHAARRCSLPGAVRREPSWTDGRGRARDHGRGGGDSRR